MIIALYCNNTMRSQTEGPFLTHLCIPRTYHNV